MFKKLFVIISLCFLLSSCENGEFWRKYRDELRPQIHEEFIKQGVCHSEEDFSMSDNYCHDIFLLQGEKTLYVNFYIPKKNFNTFDHSALLNIFNKVYVRDRIDMEITFYNGGRIQAIKEDGTKKAFRVRYYSY